MQPYGRFGFNHSIYITGFGGDCPFQEGDVFPYQPLLDQLTKFDLTGIEAADIIATGNQWDGFTFTMENIKYIP